MHRHSTLFLALALLAIMAGISFYKVAKLNYTLTSIVPQISYTLDTRMRFTGFGEALRVQTFLPTNERNQTITAERIEADGLRFHREMSGDNMHGIWEKEAIHGPRHVRYNMNVIIRPLKFDIPLSLLIPEHVPSSLERYRKGTEDIQKDHPLVVSLARNALDPKNRLRPTIENIYNYVLALEGRSFKGTTDAVTAAKLGAASCNGKSRLFVAMARNLGIPARLVGGIILNTGRKKTSHQWLELHIGDHWVPFDALNDHFAEHPANYLVLYKGDHNLFRHTRNINFDYSFSIQRRIVTNHALTSFLDGQKLNLHAFLRSFRRLNISLNLLKIILMLPFGVVIVVVARNVVGMRTFGTFLPAIMAVAFRETGLLPGLFALCVVLLVTNLIRYPLDRIGVMHTPKLAILMIAVVVTILSLGIISQEMKLGDLANIGAAGMFPIALLTITSERFAISVAEEGLKKTLGTALQTFAVLSVCYVVIASLALQAMVLAFPELLLGVVALNLWLGSWTGLRVVELWRFREFWQTSEEEPING